MTAEPKTDVLLTTDGAIATISFNRPHRRNALSSALLTGFRDLLTEVSQSDARVLIVRGEGRDFCVGADVAAADGSVPDYEQLASIYQTGRLLHEMPQVTIAAIDGGCAGPGLAWAAACDFRFASDRAVFNSAFLNVGVAGEMGLAWSLLRVVGGAWARELLFFPDKFDAETAQRRGLVTRVFPADNLRKEAEAAARRLAGFDPDALVVAKQNILSAEQLTLAEFIEVEGPRHAELAARPARMEGFRAFLEKRSPKFS